MVAAQTPTIAKIKNSASETEIRALLYIAICEVCDFFNVGKNMNDTQIAATVDLIIESYWHLKLEEIKYCFRRAMRQEKLFDRLDGNIIMGWIQNYDNERTEEAMRISEQQESEEINSRQPSEGAMSFSQYLSRLEESASNGNTGAKERLEEIASLPNHLTLLSSEEKHRKERAFKQFYYDYLSKKNDNRTIIGRTELSSRGED